MRLLYRLGRKRCQLGLERLLNLRGIDRIQSVFSAENSMSPICSLLGRVNLSEFGRKLIAQSSRWFRIKDWFGLI